jgi:hypothetical protein
MFQKQLREKERNVNIETKSCLQRTTALARENELEMLLKNLERQVIYFFN